MARLWIVLMGAALIWGCGEQKAPEAEKAQIEADLPVGTWYLYAGSSTGSRTESMDQEVTILVLEDSTYALTLLQPHIQVNFSEQGTVEYDARNKYMKFTVYSSTGVDFSGDEPRKLIDVDRVVAWERAPGTVYVMAWRKEHQFDEQAKTDREVMVLSAEDHEDSFFVRLQNRDAGDGALDVQQGTQ